ncbi:uncharacterized protein [Drosophila tropicalis]|uniref:uncharacterized protein n=1 Tax=Drosophila tropicalis TaxID=46794 RepID=UPI0035AB93F1
MKYPPPTPPIVQESEPERIPEGTGAMRPFLFVFYTLETIFNMFCMAFHITGFHSVDLSMLGWEKQAIHYFYLVAFYVFMVLTLFQSINICTGHTPTILMEIIKASAASCAFTVISLMTMYDAEKDFHLLYLGDEESDDVYIKDEPVHPFFQFMRNQSISSLTCGVLYMLHATILIDVKITSITEGKIYRDEESDYMPIPLYVFGQYVQAKLDSYEWFQEFRDNDRVNL